MVVRTSRGDHLQICTSWTSRLILLPAPPPFLHKVLIGLLAGSFTSLPPCCPSIHLTPPAAQDAGPQPAVPAPNGVPVISGNTQEGSATVESDTVGRQKCHCPGVIQCDLPGISPSGPGIESRALRRYAPHNGSTHGVLDGILIIPCLRHTSHLPTPCAASKFSSSYHAAHWADVQPMQSSTHRVAVRFQTPC